MIAAGFFVMAVLVMALLVLESRPREGHAYGIVKTVAAAWFCVVGVVGTAQWRRDYWAYDARTDEHARREREIRAGEA